jgi:Domain of unknown function (DUF4326)
MQKQAQVIRWHSSLAGNPEVVYIGRPGPWGNPFAIGIHGSRAQVLEKYAVWFFAPERKALRLRALRELRGKKLACFCVPERCHGHLLASWVNAHLG